MKLNRYRIYGDDDSEDYAWGGPLFPARFLQEVSAKTPTAAIRKFYDLSKKKHWGWRLSELAARKARKK